MALNPSTKYPGRITAPDANYTYGSSKDETSPGAGDGTPYEIARGNDIFGLQQALLRSASIVPSGSAETQLASEYLQAIMELAAGRAVEYDESGIVNAYELDLRANQQGPAGYFDGMICQFTPSVDNTGASTADVATLGVKNIFNNGAALVGGELVTTRKAKAVYDLANDRLNLVLNKSLTILDTPELLASGLTEDAWTTLNNATLNTAKAISAIVAINTTDSFLSSGGDLKLRGYFYIRKTGSALAADLSTRKACMSDEVENSGVGDSTLMEMGGEGHVNLDSSYDFDYYLEYFGATAGSWDTSELYLIGYWNYDADI